MDIASLFVHFAHVIFTTRLFTSCENHLVCIVSFTTLYIASDILDV